jgi:glycolate oxidase iron-sulfur subunit
VFDVNEFVLQNFHRPPRGRIDKRVTYLDSCHLRHGQKIVDAPRQLLKNIPGIEFVELKNPDQCCGSAGVYNLTQIETAREILEKKIEDIAQSGAEIVATSNTGCHMQIAAGIREFGLDVQVFHVMELLEASYRNEE